MRENRLQWTVGRCWTAPAGKGPAEKAGDARGLLVALQARVFPALLLAVTLGALQACAHEVGPRHGLYMSMRYTYYAALPRDAGALREEAHEMVLPELGVFDPRTVTFTDFAGTVRVPVGPNAPRDDRKHEALADLPRRCRTVFGEQVRVLAWIFLSRTGPERTGSPRADTAIPVFDPADPRHRAALVTAVQHLHGLGFDGVQLDLEPFPVADVAHVVDLLEEIREATGPEFARSVFCPKYVPTTDARLHPGFTWSSPRAYRRLARHGEQVVIPLYDFGAIADTEEAYRTLVLEAVRVLPHRIRAARKYWLALPTYRHTAQHPPTEEAATALALIAHMRPRPGGVLFFVHTGEPLDYVPGVLPR